MSSYLNRKIDFEKHNESLRELLAKRDAGERIRPLFTPHGSISNFFQNPEINTKHLTYEQYFTDPKIQIEAILDYQYWKRHNLYCDWEMGLPEYWTLYTDFQNTYEASWAGCPHRYLGRMMPDTLPILAEHKEALYDMPDLLPVTGGVVGRSMEFIAFMEDYCKDHTFMDRPIQPPQSFAGEGTDGILTLAYKLRGAENLLVDMLEDEEYFSDLMEYLCRNLIHRMQTLRDMHEKKWGVRPHGFFYADDAMCLLSHPMYKEYVLPYQKRIIDAMRDGERIGMHLCGSNMHHYGELVKELPINFIDTGFPVDFDRLRDMVGPDVEISGGPSVMLVKDGTEEAVRRETARILDSRAARIGRFTLIDANNMAPCTPVENIAAMYDVLLEKAADGRFAE